MIVVDTSALVAYLRGDDTAAAADLHALETQGTPFSIPAICVQELLQGSRDDDEWRLLEENLTTHLP